MKLSELLFRFGINAAPKINEEISGLSSDSRNAGRGVPFVCIKGNQCDGHNFVAEAYRNGARTFFVTKEISGYDDCDVIFVKNARNFLAEASFFLLGNPETELQIIGVTGTKGKSTTAYALYRILSGIGERAALIGTLGFFGIPNMEIVNTTPPPEIIAASMRSAKDSLCKYFILEVSSQAIKEERVFKIPFHAAIFTNVGRDHIGVGEHSSFEDYISAKRKLFTDFGVRLAVVNSDDEYSEYMSGAVEGTVTVGGGIADFRLEKITSDSDGVSFILDGNFCNTNLHGDYNAYNLSLAAVTAAKLTNVSLAKALSQLENIEIPGRFEIINRFGRIFVIDYAHNAMSVEATLSECKKLTDGKLIAVFGSVGERSYERRAELAVYVSRYADSLVITSDNPNFESADKICEEIFSFVPLDADASIVVDREEAIKYAFSISKSGDVIALLGKGHERWQTALGVRIPFSERDIVNALREK